MGTAIQPEQRHVQHDGTPRKPGTIPSESPQGATESNTPAQIFTMFNADARKKYIEGLKKTYLGVLLSTELNDKNSKIEDVKTQIANLIKGNESTSEINGKIKVNNKEVNVTLTKQGESIYSVKFDENSAEVAIKIQESIPLTIYLLFVHSTN